LVCLLIRAYQLTLSPLLGRCCRFQPTCSHYGLEAVRRHGLVRGGLLTVWRVLRCNPFCRGGFDPVPAAGTEEDHGTGMQPAPRN